MAIRDYIAAAALLISLLSIALNFRTYRFSRRVKIAELRVTMASKVSEGLVLHSRGRAHIEDLRSLDLGDAWQKEVEGAAEAVEDILNSIGKIHATASRLPDADVIRAFEELQTQLNRITDDGKETDHRLQALAARGAKVAAEVAAANKGS